MNDAHVRVPQPLDYMPQHARVACVKMQTCALPSFDALLRSQSTPYESKPSHNKNRMTQALRVPGPSIEVIALLSDGPCTRVFRDSNPFSSQRRSENSARSTEGSMGVPPVHVEPVASELHFELGVSC